MKNSLLLGLLVVLAFVATVAVLGYRSAMDSRETAQMVSHTHQVLEKLGRVLSRIHEGESSTRGFVATGVESYLAPHKSQQEDILRSAAELTQLTLDNPVQQERVRRLEPLLIERVRRYNDVILLRRTSGLEAAAAGLPPGRLISEKAQVVLDDMETEERRLLTLRVDASDRSLRRTMGLLGLLTAAVLCILGGLFLSARQSAVARTRAEEGIRRSEQRFKDLYDNAPCGYFTLDSVGSVVRMNATALNWMGYPREEVEGKLHYRGVLEPGNLEGFEKDFESLRSSWQPISGREYSFRRRSGSSFPVILNIARVSVDEGDEDIRISFLNISERKRIERELDQFFSTSLDLLGMADLKQGHFTRVNPGWQNLLGWTAEEICSKPWLDFVHPDDVASTIQAAGLLSKGEAVAAFSNRYRCKDGMYRWLDWRVPAPLPGSQVAFCLARDITEDRRKGEVIVRLNQDLAKRIDDALASNRELEAFSYSVSHDLRAPLRAIDGFSRILVEDFASVLGGEGQRLLNMVCSSSRQMGQLIDDLLQYSRLGRKDLETSAVDMASLARDAVEESRKAQQGRRPEVGIGALPGIHGDRVLLRQVWINLVSNAFKYSRTQQAAKVEIAGERRNGEAVFSVRDNGVGFDMQYADKLFGVFQRLHSVREFEGTGVGLAIVHRIVQRHGGRVWAEGKPGAGAVFHFSIPIRGET